MSSLPTTSPSGFWVSSKISQISSWISVQYPSARPSSWSYAHCPQATWELHLDADVCPEPWAATHSGWDGDGHFCSTFRWGFVIWAQGSAPLQTPCTSLGVGGQKQGNLYPRGGWGQGTQIPYWPSMVLLFPWPPAFKDTQKPLWPL